MLAFVQSLPIIGPLIKDIKLVLIALAFLLVTNGITGLFFYVKGHNAAAAKCQINSIIRQRDEMKRDRDNAVANTTFLKQKLTELQTKQDGRDEQDRQAASDRKPIDGCVVPLRVRDSRHRKQAPAANGSAR